MATTLYVHGDCRHCRALRERLEGEGRSFRLKDVAASPELVPELLKLTDGRRIVPVLVDGVRIEVAPEGGTEF